MFEINAKIFYTNPKFISINQKFFSINFNFLIILKKIKIHLFPILSQELEQMSYNICFLTEWENIKIS